MSSYSAISAILMLQFVESKPDHVVWGMGYVGYVCQTDSSESRAALRVRSKKRKNTTESSLVGGPVP